MTKTPTQPIDPLVIDTTTATWQSFPVKYIDAQLEHIPLYEDADTGMTVAKMTYRAGFTNPWHDHPCAHGFYVLDGSLKTHEGTYRPGSWVWFPEGGIMEHGATATEDVTFLFITNKTFGMHYLGDDTDPEAPHGPGVPASTR